MEDKIIIINTIKKMVGKIISINISTSIRLLVSV